MPKRQPQPRDLPLALLVASGEPQADALARRLRLLGLEVAVESVDTVAQTAFVRAPDLLVLAGDAAKDGGLRILKRLGAHHATASTPVVLVGGGGDMADAGRAALRHGVVAIVDRAEGVEGVARRVVAVARSLPSRRGHVSGALGEAELDELLALLTESRRTGVLSVRDLTGAVLMHLVVRGDRPVDETIAELAARLRGIGADDHGALHYDFVESDTASLASLRRREADAERRLIHRRLGLIERGARAQPLLGALRGAGAQVACVEARGRLEEARALIPSVLIVDGAALEEWASEVLRDIQEDPLLRWASLLVIDHMQVVEGARVDVAALASGVVELLQPDLELVTRVRAGASVEARLETIGPARTLRALAASERPMRFSARHPRARVELALVGGRVLAPQAFVRSRADVVEGDAALATLLHLPAARLSCARFDPSDTAPGLPVDEALARATRAQPALRRVEAPPPRELHAKALPGSPSGSEVMRLVDRLERLLGLAEEEVEETTRRYLGLGLGEDEEEDEPTVRESVSDEDRPTRSYDPGLVSRLCRRMLLDHPPQQVQSPPPMREPTVKLGSSTVAAPAPSLDGFEGESTLRDAGLGETADEPPTVPHRPRARAASAVTPDQVEPGDADDEAEESETAPARPAPMADEPPTRPARLAALAAAPATGFEEDELTMREGGASWLDGGEPRTEPKLEPDPVPTEPKKGLVPEAPEAETVAGPVLPGDPASGEASGEIAFEEAGRGVTWVAAMVVALVAFALGVGGAFVYVRWQRATADAGPGVASGPREVAAPREVELGSGTGAGAGAAAGGGAGAGTRAGSESGAETGGGGGAEGTAAGEAAASADEDEGEGARADEGGAASDGPSGVPDPLEGRDADFDLAALGIEVDPDAAGSRRALRVRVSNRRGAAALRQGRYARAERAYRSVLRLDPGNAPATIGLVRTYRGLDDGPRAVLFAQRLARLRPERASSFILLSDAFETAGATRAAHAAARRAVRLDPESRAARRRLHAHAGR